MSDFSKFRQLWVFCSVQSPLSHSPHKLGYLPLKTNVNLRSGGGGGHFGPPPLWFFEDNSKNEREQRKPKLGIPFHWSILHLLWNFCVGVHIRSGHQVESRDLTSKKVYTRATATVLNRIFSSFQNLIRPLVPTICISRIFDISMTWGQVKILTSPLWVNGGKIEILPNASVRCNSFRIHVLLGHSWWPKVKCWPVTPLRSSEVTEVTNRFLQITWDWEELETWKWSQCVCLVNTLRLICNLGQAVTLTWGQILTLTFQGHAIHVSMRLDEAKHDGVKIIALSFQTQKLSLKTVSLKNAVWPFVTSDA